MSCLSLYERTNTAAYSSFLYNTVKLFHEWINNWTEDEKNHFLSHIKASDPEFYDKLNQSLSQMQEKVELENASIEGSSDLLPAIEVDIEKANGVSPGSLTSSPLSSLSQPRSPQDSGLDENHFELESNIENKSSSVQESDADIPIKEVQSSEPVPNESEISQINNIPLLNCYAKTDTIISQKVEETV